MCDQRFWRELSTWSEATFGDATARGPIGPLRHLRMELEDALTAAHNADAETLSVELVDCLFLLFDAARRGGMSWDSLRNAAMEKLEINRQRSWPRCLVRDDPIEHIRTEQSP